MAGPEVMAGLRLCIKMKKRVLYFGSTISLSVANLVNFYLHIYSVSTRVRQPPKVSSKDLRAHVTKRSHAMSNDGVRQSEKTFLYSQN